MGTMAETGSRPDVRKRYPHMAELDGRVWSLYLREYGDDIDAVWYDVWCGELSLSMRAGSDADRRRADGIYSKRLYQIWEIKPFGNSVALGQALMYLELFRQRYPQCMPVQTCCVCDHFDRDSRPVMSKYGVECVAVGKANNYSTEHSVYDMESS